MRYSQRLQTERASLWMALSLHGKPSRNGKTEIHNQRFGEDIGRVVGVSLFGVNLMLTLGFSTDPNV